MYRSRLGWLALVGMGFLLMFGGGFVAAAQAAPQAAPSCFSDVDTSDWFEPFVCWMYDNGLTVGYPDGTFRPLNNITRAEVSVFIKDVHEMGHWGETWTGSGTGLTLNGGIEGLSVQAQDTGVYGRITGLYTGDAGVFGWSTGTTVGYGVRGEANATSGVGVYGYARSTTGNTQGVHGESRSPTGTGLYGYASSTTGTNYGLYAKTDSTSGYAGYFEGDVYVNGNLSKASGSFKIDDPLDPANKYLYHSFVESPDMKNIYDGVVTLDDSGGATVQMPDWFQALNQDFRYQLTAVGSSMPNLYVAQEIQNNQFRIAGGVAGKKVSWQVTGTRHDPYANDHRIPVEQTKPASEQGTYLYPQGYSQPANKGLDQQLQQSIDNAQPARGN